MRVCSTLFITDKSNCGGLHHPGPSILRHRPAQAQDISSGHHWQQHSHPREHRSHLGHHPRHHLHHIDLHPGVDIPDQEEEEHQEVLKPPGQVFRGAPEANLDSRWDDPDRS